MPPVLRPGADALDLITVLRRHDAFLDVACHRPPAKLCDDDVSSATAASSKGPPLTSAGTEPTVVEVVVGHYHRHDAFPPCLDRVQAVRTGEGHAALPLLGCWFASRRPCRSDATDGPGTRRKGQAASCSETRPTGRRQDGSAHAQGRSMVVTRSAAGNSRHETDSTGAMTSTRTPMDRSRANRPAKSAIARSKDHTLHAPRTRDEFLE